MMAKFDCFVNSWSKNWPEVWCSVRGGMPPFVFASNPRPVGSAVPVFHYHVVNAGEFERDLQFLQRNGYHTATADELADHLNYSRSLGPNHVVLSFDDGPLNLHEVAYPLLREYGQRAIAFIAPGLHIDACDHIRSDRLCTWEEIQRMHTSGVFDFQSHTYEHRLVARWPQPWPLTGVDDALVQQARGNALPLAEDLRRARETIEQRLEKRVEHLAFPNYRATAEAVAVAIEVGYRGLWWGTCPRRPWNVPGDSADRIVRISGEFLRRLPGAGRRSLRSILRDRYAASVFRWLRRGPIPWPSQPVAAKVVK